ncbi:MAG: hypothetical protein U1F42_01170 [Candidatus Competibacteraceae bacterium]
MNIKRGGATESIPTAPVLRTLQAEFLERPRWAKPPRSRWSGWINKRAGLSALPIAVPVGARLDIVVQAQSGFVVIVPAM